MLLMTAWIVAISARWNGSPKGKFRVALGAYVIIIAIDCTVALLPTIIGLHSTLWINLSLIIVNVCLAFLVLRRVFRLSARRTFVPFAALILAIVLQFVIFLAVVRPYLLEAFVMPTKSMAPTLVPGNRFVVNKLARPARWDLVTYHSNVPESPVWCKRIVGLPGERLRFNQGNIYINDQLVSAPPVVAGRYHATLPTAPTKYRDGETIVLSDREFFMVGDNVDVSADSRIYGPTDVGSLIGVVDFVYWPPSGARMIRR
jgi:signal peptidase I